MVGMSSEVLNQAMQAVQGMQQPSAPQNPSPQQNPQVVNNYYYFNGPAPTNFTVTNTSAPNAASGSDSGSGLWHNLGTFAAPIVLAVGATAAAAFGISSAASSSNSLTV